jgi:hypothetical protein
LKKRKQVFGVPIIAACDSLSKAFFPQNSPFPLLISFGSLSFTLLRWKKYRSHSKQFFLFSFVPKDLAQFQPKTKREKQQQQGKTKRK